MKSFCLALLFLSFLPQLGAQTTSPLHHGSFKRSNMVMHTKMYKPDNWEKPLYDSALKTAFPSDLMNAPSAYVDKFIHLIGVVDSVVVDENMGANFLLDNKFWDYMEDYSIQDEVMFVSNAGDGKFWVRMSGFTSEELEAVKRFPAEKKLFLIYGHFKEIAGQYPLLVAKQVKYIDYELYTTNVFYYEVKRTKTGEVATGKKGKVELTNFKFLNLPKRGQNK